MAVGFASFTFFFCLLCFSTLSTAVDLSTIDRTNYDLSHESNTKSDEADTIFLPTERLDESAPVIESQPGISGSEIAEPESEVETLKPLESSQTSDSVPITMITFRPLNRYMPWLPMQFPSRPRHRCHHNHKPRPWNPRIPRHQIPYGNDMILSNGDEKSLHVLPDDRVPNKIPMRWTRFGRFDPRFTEEPGMGRSEEVMMRPHHHHHHDDLDDQGPEHDHHDHDDHDHEHERDDDHEHEHERDHHHDHDDHDHEHDHHHDHDDHDHEHDHHHDHHNYNFYERDHEDGGLMRSIRKFLQHF